MVGKKERGQQGGHPGCAQTLASPEGSSQSFTQLDVKVACETPPRYAVSEENHSDSHPAPKTKMIRG
jgi:hypothetical protein